MKKVRLMDVVALEDDMPDRGLVRGQVGTVIELLAPEVFEVEFSDNEGQIYASVSVCANQMIVLHHHSAKMA